MEITDNALSLPVSRDMSPRAADRKSPHSRRHPGGRPRKYSEASQPVTVTLPKTTLRQLEQIDPDRGGAIVKLARQASRASRDGEPSVELVDIGGGSGLVVIGTTSALNSIGFLRMVEVSAGRYLIALLPGHGIHELEVALLDTLHERNSPADPDSSMITKLLELLRSFRKSEGVSTAQILFLRLGTGS